MSAENPQKAPLANCLMRNCSVLVFDNPTRGLNIACRLEVYQTIQDLAEQGVTVIAASTDAEELVAFCDRIAVMVDGRVLKTFDRSQFSVEKIRNVMKQHK